MKNTTNFIKKHIDTLMPIGLILGTLLIGVLSTKGDPVQLYYMFKIFYFLLHPFIFLLLLIFLLTGMLHTSEFIRKKLKSKASTQTQVQSVEIP